jgi:hypothetical protein
MIKVGSRVYDKADPRHVGIVRQLNHGAEGSTARIMWEETGWFSCRVPVRDLRLAPRDRDSGRGEQFLVKRALAMRAERGGK